MDLAAVSPLGTEGLREIAPGIFYASTALPIADRATIEFLKQQAWAHPMRRARVCAHASPDATQHDMLIVSHRMTYVAPHRHLTRSESFLVIEGDADLLLFEPDGRLGRRIAMGPAHSARPFFYRMPPRQYHALEIGSEFLVFSESTSGPFDSSGSENAPWAPAPENLAAGRSFIASLPGARGAP